MRLPAFRAFLSLPLLLLAAAATAAVPYNPEPCNASPITHTVTATWSTDDPKLKWLKKLEGFLNKLPIVKKAEVSASVAISATKGEECCPGATVPTKYEEPSGTGSLSADVQFVGAGGKINPFVEVPIWFGYSLMVEVKAEASISGGGSLSGDIEVGGRDGECSCMWVSAGAALSANITATIEGRAFVAIFDEDEPLEPVRQVSAGAKAEGKVEASLSVPQYKRYIGKSCPDDSDEGLKLCWQLPEFTFTIEIELPLGLPDYSYEFNWDIFKSLGMEESSGCYPK